MKKTLLILVAAMMAGGEANSAAPVTLNGQKYATQQGWTVQEGARKIVSPFPSVVPLVYEAKNASAASCGLLTGSDSAPVFIEIAGPEEGGWPECLGFNDVASFKLNNREYLVFEYLVQDTRDDTYRNHFYLLKDGAGRFVAAQEFNSSADVPNASRADRAGNRPRAKEGITLARSMDVSKSLTDVHFSDRDFLLDGNRSFGLYQDKAKTRCTFVVDNGIAAMKMKHDAFADAQGDKCAEILASGKLQKNDKTYYIAMYKGASQNRVAVFSVDKSNAIAVESVLAAKVGKDRKLADMKSVKKALAAAAG